MKKICIGLIVCMFIISMLPGIVVDIEADDHSLEARKFIENRDIIPIYTSLGLEKVPNGKGKPGIIVTIINPSNDETVSSIVTIQIDSNDIPSI